MGYELVVPNMGSEEKRRRGYPSRTRKIYGEVAVEGQKKRNKKEKDFSIPAAKAAVPSRC